MATAAQQSPFAAYASQYAQQYGVPLSLFDAQISAESGWNPNAISSTGAIGLGQLMPSTAASLGVNPYNPRQNLQGAAQYDAQLYKQTGNWSSALQAYNEGPTAFATNNGTPQTQQYANSILQAAGMSNSTSSAPNSPYQQIINDKTGAFSVLPAGAPIPPGYSSIGNTAQSATSAVDRQAANARCVFSIMDPIPWIGCNAGNLVLIFLGLVIIVGGIWALMVQNKAQAITNLANTAKIL